MREFCVLSLAHSHSLCLLQYTALPAQQGSIDAESGKEYSYIPTMNAVAFDSQSTMPPPPSSVDERPYAMVAVEEDNIKN